MIILLFIFFGILTAIAHLWFLGFPNSTELISEIVLLHQFVVPNVLIGVLGFYINVITPEKTAKKLGWPGGPFQIKYGFTQLHLGVMGLLSIWFRGNFWLGTLVSLYMYGISGLWTHGMELMKKKRETNELNPTEFWSIVFDIIYHVALTLISFKVPNVWSF